MEERSQQGHFLLLRGPSDVAHWSTLSHVAVWLRGRLGDLVSTLGGHVSSKLGILFLYNRDVNITT